MSDPVTKFLTVDDALEVARLVTGEPAEPLDEEAAFQFMYDLVRGRLTAPDIAAGLREFAA